VCANTLSKGDIHMYPKFIRDFSHKKLVARFQTLDIHSWQRIPQRAQWLAQPHRVGALFAVVMIISLACSSVSLFARERGDRTASDATLSISTTSLVFGTVSVNMPTTQSLTVTSTGSGTLTIRAATISGSGFAVSGATFPVILSPNQTAILTVQFDPASAGAASGSLILTSNSSSGRSTVVSLSGTGVSATVPTLSVNATTISFGDVNLNTPATQSLTLTSTGTGAVTVNSATVSGAGFSVSGATFPLALAPSQAAVLSVQFDPTAAGAALGALSLSSNSSTGASTTVSLTGTGASASYQVNLTWNAPTSSPDPVAGYEVFRAPNGSTSYQQLNASSVAQTSYADTTVQDGQTYNYYVESVDGSGNTSAPSNMANVNVP
jgi:centrosomal CEP192-like protein